MSKIIRLVVTALMTPLIMLGIFISILFSKYEIQRDEEIDRINFDLDNPEVI